MLDLDALLHAPVMEALANAVASYSIGGGQAFDVPVVFDEGYSPQRIVTEPEVNEVAPTLGIRLSLFPSDFDPRNAKGDTFTVRGIAYRVTNGEPDSHGWAILKATRA